MQFTTITSLLALVATLTSAALAEKRQFEAQLTFIGTAGVEYTLSVPTNSSVFTITNPLIVLQIGLVGNATCVIWSIDGDTTTITGTQTIAVAPQTPRSGYCFAL